MKKCNKFMLLFILGIGMLFSSCVYAEDNDPSQAISKDWVSTLNLSTLNENVIYRYAATATTHFPTIVNDTGKNLIIYLKEKDGLYAQSISTAYNIEGLTASGGYNEYLAGEAFNIYFKAATNQDILDRVNESDIILLSAFNDGDALNHQNQKYIYNDTENDIVLRTKNTISGVETVKDYTIPKNTIYGFDKSNDVVLVNPTTEPGGNTGGGTGDNGTGGDTGNTGDNGTGGDTGNTGDNGTGGDTGNTGTGENTGNTGNNNTSNNTNDDSNEDEENPHTGIGVSVIVVVGMAMIAVLMFIVSKKNKVFNKI